MTVEGDRKATPPPPREERRTLTLVSASHATQHMYVALLPLTYPAVVVAFHLSYAALGLGLGLVGVVGGCVQATAGVVSRRIPTRFILGGQNILLGVCATLGGLSPSFAPWVATRGLSQVAASQQHPVGSAVLSRRYPNRRGFALSTHVVGGNIGSLLVPVPAAILIVHIGWRGTMWVFAAPMVVMGLVFLLTFPHRADISRHRSAAAPPSPGPRPPRLLDRRLAVLVILASTVAAGGRGLGTLSAFVPLYLRDGVHLPTIVVGLLFNLMLAGGVLGPLVAGLLSDRFGRRRVLWTAYALSAVLVSLYGVAAHQAAVLIPLTLGVGLVAYAESPLLQALLSEAVSRESQATIFGYYFAIAYGVGSLWVIALGFIIQDIGFAAGFLMMGASYVLAGCILIPARGRRPSVAAG
ncbi:MAG TPA: MFS transporter [Verrucomicrobiae bacterium]|nr:MFS transporter [Verrucomicrobiae bacterium]